MVLHKNKEDSMPCGFRQEDLLCFPYISVYKTGDPRGGSIFDPRANT